MSSCIIEWVDQTHLKISGTIDEYAEFESLIKKFPEELWIDFSGVTRINSSGVRQWLKAIMNCDAKIHFEKCAAAVVDQFTLVPHFLGKNGSVESFEVLFFCYACDCEIQKYLKIGEDINRFTGTMPPLNVDMKCETCGGDVEIDHNVEIYFSFLKDAG